MPAALWPILMTILRFAAGTGAWWAGEKAVSKIGGAVGKKLLGKAATEFGTEAAEKLAASTAGKAIGGVASKVPLVKRLSARTIGEYAGAAPGYMGGMAAGMAGWTAADMAIDRILGQDGASEPMHDQAFPGTFGMADMNDRQSVIQEADLVAALKQYSQMSDQDIDNLKRQGGLV